jgi:hypothetical protein
MISDDTDGVFTSATRPLSAEERQLAADANGIAQRLKLAEEVIIAVTGTIADGAVIEDDVMEALALWEEARGQRFIFTDECEDVIATGRGGLYRYFAENGYDVDQTAWTEYEPTEVISIWCDADSIPAEVEGPGNKLVEKTVAEWLQTVKRNGMLCTREC